MSASTPANYIPIPQDWRWVKPLRQGGQGSIHLYRRPAGDQVAVKILLQQHERLVARFKRGIDILHRLNHDNVIRIYDWGVDPKYGLWYATPYHSRGSLSGWGRLDEVNAALVVFFIAHALDHAHSNGIIHRDIKPDNIVMTDDGEPILIDWDLGKAEDHSTFTLDGAPLGTEGFMPDEQMVTPSSVDSSVDIFALGITFRQITELKDQNLVKLVNEMIAKEAPQRPTAAQVADRVASFIKVQQQRQQQQQQQRQEQRRQLQIQAQLPGQSENDLFWWILGGGAAVLGSMWLANRMKQAKK